MEGQILYLLRIYANTLIKSKDHLQELTEVSSDVVTKSVTIILL